MTDREGASAPGFHTRSMPDHVYVVCISIDAMRLALGKGTRNFTADEIFQWIEFRRREADDKAFLARESGDG